MPSIRQRFHLSPCSDFRSHFYPQDGQWRRPSDRQLIFSPSPSTGGSFPFDLEAPVSGVGVSFDDGTATELTITTITIERHPFTQLPTAYTLDFDADLPASGEVLKVRIPGAMGMSVTTTEQVKIWAGRRDFSGRDFSQVVAGGLVTIRDTRYIVRSESGPWTAGDAFNDEDGVKLTVQGVEQIGRQYLELLVRSGGGVGPMLRATLKGADGPNVLSLSQKWKLRIGGADRGQRVR